MSFEVHVTRGEGFDAPGAQPITFDEWRDIVQSHAGIRPDAELDDLAELGRSLLRFDNGLITTKSPADKELKQLQEIAQSLGASLCGEDGERIGRSVAEDVRSSITRFSDIDVSGITELLGAQLADVSQGVTSSTLQLPASLKACCDLDGEVARAALVYLLTRAIECGGNPAPSLTCAAAHLLRHDPSQADRLRAPPTQDWIREVVRLADHVGKRPGHYVIRPCHNCRALNRIALFPKTDQFPKCGRCKTYLLKPWL